MVYKKIESETGAYQSVDGALFDTKEEAIEARKQAEIEYFGEYRNINEDVS